MWRGSDTDPQVKPATRDNWTRLRRTHLVLYGLMYPDLLDTAFTRFLTGTLPSP